MILPTIVVVGVAALLGLAFGSFANVVIYRLPRNESLLKPVSHCPSCHTPILRRHNVPVLGWLMLRGRCHSCQVRISPRYPLVELVIATSWVGATLALGLSIYLPAVIVALTVGIVATMMALDKRRATVMSARQVGAASS